MQCKGVSGSEKVGLSQNLVVIKKLWREKSRIIQRINTEAPITLQWADETPHSPISVRDAFELSFPWPWGPSLSYKSLKSWYRLSYWTLTHPSQRSSPTCTTRQELSKGTVTHTCNTNPYCIQKYPVSKNLSGGWWDIRDYGLLLLNPDIGFLTLYSYPPEHYGILPNPHICGCRLSVITIHHRQFLSSAISLQKYSLSWKECTWERSSWNQGDKPGARSNYKTWETLNWKYNGIVALNCGS